MRAATYKDRGLVIEILTACFVNNKSVNYIIPQDGLKLLRIRRLMAYAFEMCSLFGEVFIGDQGKACALLMYPELKQTTLKSISLDLKLVFNCMGIGNIAKALAREREIKAKQPKERMAYLWFIGVDPQHQKSGLGKRLLEEVIARCASDNRPVYLETSVPENLLWYKKFGFEVYDSLELSYTLYFLKRQLH